MHSHARQSSIQTMSLPFVIDDVYAGFAEVRGVLRLEQQAVVLEFKLQDSVLNVLKTDVTSVTIPFDQIEQLVFRKGWFGFGNRLCLRAKSLKALEGLPGSHDVELVIEVARKDRPLAHEIVSKVNYQLSEYHLKMLEHDKAK